METQSEPIQRFLLQTSILGRLSVTLCVAVTGDEQSAAQLEAAEQNGIEIAEFLRQYLGQPIILVGSSVGSITGTMMVKHRPELFAAYVGTNQNSTPDASELSYQLTLEWLRASGNTQGVKAVEKLGARKGKLTAKEFTALHQWTLKKH